jgi:hypothetical protein
MSAKVASALVAIAIVLFTGALAPAASAAPIVASPTPVSGSVAFCFNIPLGVFSFSICI